MKFFSCTHCCRIFLLAIIFSLSLTLLASPALAEAEPNLLIFEVSGNNHIPAEKILGSVSNSKVGEPLDAQKVQADLQAIMALGYFSNVRTLTDEIFGGIKLIFEVVENPLFKEVRFSGLTKMNPEELKPYFSQKPGEVFNAAVFNADLANAIKYCRDKKGLFIEPKLKEMQITPDGVVSLQLIELRYGKIKITGLEKTKEVVIRRELSIKEGEIIDYNQLKEEYLKLMRLRLFDSIDIRFGNSDTPGRLELVFDVKEAKVGTFSVGVSFNESDGKFGGLLGFSDSNLMGLGQSISMDLNISESRNNVQFSFNDPWLNDKQTSFGLSVWNTDSTITSTLTDWLPADPGVYYVGLVQSGLSLSFGRPFGKESTARIKFSFEKNEIDQMWAKDAPEHEDDNDIDLPPSPLRPYDFWDNSITLSLDRNKLKYQDANFVNGGFRIMGSLEAAGSLLGGEFDYNKLILEGKWFNELLPHLVWGTRLQGAFLTGDYPDYDALYLGGVNRLRGFGDKRFESSVSSELIGESYLLANTELRYLHPSLGGLEFVLFYDGGLVNNLEEQSPFKSDYGVGFRYNVPFLGVIRVDQAWNSDGDSNFVFSLGEMF